MRIELYYVSRIPARSPATIQHFFVSNAFSSTLKPSYILNRKPIMPDRFPFLRVVSVRDSIITSPRGFQLTRAISISSELQLASILRPYVTSKPLRFVINQTIYKRLEVL